MNERLNVRPLAPEGRSDAILKQFSELIFSGALRVGDRLPSEAELCTMFSVGRSSIREALRVLDNMGILKRTRQGTFVSGQTIEGISRHIAYWVFLNNVDMRELFEIRSMLEAESARLAAACRTEAEIETLKAIHEDMKRAGENQTQYVQANVAFHMEIARIARNKVLVAFLESMTTVIQLAQRRVIQQEGVISQAILQHQRVLDAVEAGDQESARNRMYEHLQEIWKSLA